MQKAAHLLKWLVNMFKSYWQFDGVEFEHFEVDDRPNFYMMIITLRPTKEGD